MDSFLSNERRPLYEVKANLFKGLAHPVRVRVLELLAGGGRVSVAELISETGLEASHMSQHLAVLRKHHLVTAERRGVLVFYRLAYPEVADLLRVARVLLAEILETTHEQLVSTMNLPPLSIASSRRG